MARRIPEEELQAIEAIVAAHPPGVGLAGIEDELHGNIPRRTLQYRLKHLVAAGRLVMEREKRWVKYSIPRAEAKPRGGLDGAEGGAELAVPTSEGVAKVVSISGRAQEVRRYVRQPMAVREPVGYDRSFLDGYRPNVSAYLSDSERAHLKKVGTSPMGGAPAGTYARRILNRLLIDLSWNSSRLEGNTYSLLETRRLIEFRQEAEGRQLLEAQMIMNHRDAIEFLVASAEEIGFNRHTVLNLHALLANNLLADPAATGRLRHIPVGIEQSVFHPLEVPQLIEECFDQVLAKAAATTDPFEQSFFVMVQLPYLQPFDDVNKRVSRLAANIPLIKANLTPLSFTDVPTQTYTEAVLGVYELRNVDLLKDVFIWAYERSASRYAAVRQSLGQPDPFRLKHRAALREIVRGVVLERMDRKTALAHITSWANQKIDATERDEFSEVAENELLALHEGNFARYQIRPTDFRAWQEIWSA